MLSHPFRRALLSLVTLLPTTLANDNASCWTNNCTDPITLVPAPWTLHGTGWAIPIPPVLTLPIKSYSPLERSPSSAATSGLYTGVIGAIQIIRYTDTPVGPYDEFVLIPGAFTYTKPFLGVDAPGTDLRVTRMYVSQKYTTYNGRANWNIPKHLARFDWTENGDGSTTLKLYPHDTTGDLTESYPSEKPFFTSTIFPEVSPDVNISLTSPLLPQGVPARLNQAPLPEGNGSYGETVGTGTWKNTVLAIESVTPGVGLVDLKQEGDATVDGGDANVVGDEVYENFWPTIGRWNAAVKLEDFEIVFNQAEEWA